MADLKKNSTTKINSSSPSLLHPPYFQMICEAITTMKDRTGSSQPAIAKFIEENYSKQLPQNFKKILSIQLKRFIKSEKLIKVKNSYKINDSESPNSVQKKMNTEKKKPANKAAGKNTETKSAVKKNSVEKAKKMKRLSQVKTPENMKMIVIKEKVKKNKAVAPLKRKMGAKLVKTDTTTPAKKAKN